MRTSLLTLAVQFVLVASCGLGGGAVFAQTLRVPFDFSKSAIGIEATVNATRRSVSVTLNFRPGQL
jgi:hypothetical protein